MDETGRMGKSINQKAYLKLVSDFEDSKNAVVRAKDRTFQRGSVKTMFKAPAIAFPANILNDVAEPNTWIDLICIQCVFNKHP